jgi:hypothetical protein
MTTFEQVIHRLDPGAKFLGPGRARFHCPGHSDRNASGDGKEGDDGRVLLICRIGCSLEQILESAGLQKRDLFPSARPLSSGELRSIHRKKLAAEAREQTLKNIERRVFDAERLAEIEVHRWAGALARIPEGHEQERTLTQLFHLSLTAFRESEAESIHLIERRHLLWATRSVRPEVERVAA